MTATEEQIARWKAIYDAYRGGETQLSIAKRYDLCTARVREIVQRYEQYLLMEDVRSEQNVS